MRQRQRTFLPIVLIALMVQILAPIGACWAAAFAISDPLQAIEICHSDKASTSGLADQGGQDRAHSGACAVCCAIQANASFDTPQAISVVTPYRDVLCVVWRDHATDRSETRFGSNAQARAPPFPA
jgi:Protein of unknown function (DUF2946)